MIVLKLFNYLLVCCTCVYVSDFHHDSLHHDYHLSEQMLCCAYWQGALWSSGLTYGHDGMKLLHEALLLSTIQP